MTKDTGIDPSVPPSGVAASSATPTAAGSSICGFAARIRQGQRHGDVGQDVDSRAQALLL